MTTTKCLVEEVEEEEEAEEALGMVVTWTMIGGVVAMTQARAGTAGTADTTVKAAWLLRLRA